MPRPGPGKGCLKTKDFGIPSSKPTFLTSSLNRKRSGSMISLKFTWSGRPPTLWWDLMVTDSPPCPLSTTSG